MLTARFTQLDLKQGDWVLDLGCGEGRHIHGLHVLNKVNAIGVDLDELSLEKAREGLATLPPHPAESDLITEFKTADALKLPFKDNHFDVVICSEVLEHVPLYTDVLTEVRRVLKPEGRLCVTVPRAWPERLCWRLAPPPDGYAHQPGGHIRIFDPVDLRVSVEQAGFKFQKKHHAHGLHSPYWWLKCLFWDREEDHPLVKAYHQLLVWDIMKKPLLTRVLDWVLTPIMGKSLALYFGPRPE